MIELTKEPDSKKHWSLKLIDTNDQELKLNLNLISSSLTNRFEFVEDFLKDFINLMDDNALNWYYNLLNEYINSGYNSEIISKSIEDGISYVEEYIKLKDIDFSKFSDKSKATKTSIFFNETDIYNIAVATSCLKLYAIYFYDSKLQLSDNILNHIYNKIIEQSIKDKTTDKIFESVKARTYKSSIPNRYMWDLIKLSVMETPDTSVMNVFNFFMKNLLVLLNIEQNPVHYIVKIADDNVRWMLVEIYKEKIIYEDDFGSTDQIYGSTVSKDTFHIYCCNDVLLKTSKMALDILEEEHAKNNSDKFLDIKDRLEDIKFVDPSTKLFNMPIISNVLDIPYKYLLSAPAKNLVLVSYFMHHIGKNSIQLNYPILSEFLLSYNPNKLTYFIKSSYKLRDVDSIIESQVPIFGINSKKLKWDIISPIVGILSSCKRNLVSVVDGYKFISFTYNDIEADSIDFYTNLYSHNLNEKIFNPMKDELNNYFK